MNNLPGKLVSAFRLRFASRFAMPPHLRGSRFWAPRGGLSRTGAPRRASIGLGLLLVLAFLALPLSFRAPSIVRAASQVSILTVTNLNDSGPGSLRQAIADAAPADTIIFSVTGMITLTSGELVVNKDLTLGGPGAASLSISGNQASVSQASRVIHNSAFLTVVGLTIRDGEAGPGSGGGILNEGTGELAVVNSVLTGNRAQKGGGVYNSPGGSVLIVNSTFSANATRLVDVGADASGAGVYNAGPVSDVSITNSTFYFNDVHDNGSGLYNEATATVANSTFTLGQSGSAAVYNNSGTLQLNNVTITLNNGRKTATGLLAAGGSVSLSNSIIAANTTSGNTSLPDCGGTITSAGHNLIGNATGCGISSGSGDLLGSSVSPLNARLGPLTNNGGPTSTHTLLVGSPAIDAGSPGVPGSGGGACEAFDQRHLAARPQDGDKNGSVLCDIGAVEIFQAASTHVYVPITLK